MLKVVVTLLVGFMMLFTLRDNSSPTHVHIAIAGASSMTVSWQIIGAERPGKITFWEEDEDRHRQTIVAETKCTYYGSGFHYHATLDNLKPGTKYSYQIQGALQVRTFMSPAPSTHSNVTVAVVADWGYGPLEYADETLLRLRLLKNTTNLILHAGDISYADNAFGRPESSPLVEGYEYVQNGFMTVLESVASEVPYMVAVGNHESECHSPLCLAQHALGDGLRNFTAYNCRWKMPNSHNMWHSFDYGPIHFVAINTETDFADAPEEQFGDCTHCKLPAGSFGRQDEYLTWLKEDLTAAAANRAIVPWIVTFGHRPMYSDDGDTCITPSVCNTVGGLIDSFSDLHITGHLHYYSRQVPLHSSIRPAHVLVGGAGNDEWLDRGVTGARGGVSEKFNWLSYGMAQSMASFSVINRATLEWKAIRSIDGYAFDTLIIDRQLNGSNHITIESTTILNS